MSWELYGDENIQIICLRLTFYKIPHKKFGCPEECFLRVGCPKRHPDALLAKTMGEGVLKAVKVFNA